MRRLPCFILLALLIFDLFVPDPVPLVDEALLLWLSTACFARGGGGKGGKVGAFLPRLLRSGDGAGRG